MQRIQGMQARSASGLMQAVRVHRFGGIDAMIVEDAPRPVPGPGQVLVRVKAAGVGPWDARVREGRSVLPHPLPLTPGSDIAGFVEATGPEVSGFYPGDRVFGVTNAQFTGGYAEFALAEASMIAPLPGGLSFVEAASVPVAATTAWQMLFDHGDARNGSRVLIHGAAGSVGAFAVQFARLVGAIVIATARTRDVDYLRTLRPDRIVDVDQIGAEPYARDVDIVLDLVGGETQAPLVDSLKSGGILVSAVAKPDEAALAKRSARGVFFIVAVTTNGLAKIAKLFDSGEILTKVGDVLPLSQARLAHEMLAGKPHKRGKIVLAPDE